MTNRLIEQLWPHEQRVVEEKTALDERIAKLTAFIDSLADPGSVFAKLSSKERGRLYRQHVAMVTYSQVLAERIAGFICEKPAAPVGADLIVPAATATPTPSPAVRIEAPSESIAETPIAAAGDHWKPTPGRIMTVKGYIANGTDEHPGIITRVFGVGEGALINVTVLPDLQSPKILSSIPAYTSRAAARDAVVGPSRANGYAFFPDRG